MVAKSHSRGHETIHTEHGWIYSDDGESINIERPCLNCNRMPDKNGFDACLGCVPGAVSACCGHGVEKPIIKFPSQSA